MIKRIHVLIGLLAAMCGCIGDDDMAVNPPQSFDAAMTGIRQVIDQNGAIVKATDGGPVYRLAAGSGLNFVYDITKNAYRADVTGLIGGFVLNTRQVIAGQGLTGGGDLSADRTFNASVVAPLTINFANQIELGTINDVIHGNRGGGALHSDAGPMSSGFMPASAFKLTTQKLAATAILTLPTTINVNDYSMVLVDCSGGNVTITLDNSTWTNNYEITVKMASPAGGNSVRVTMNDGTNFEDGNANIDLTNDFASVTFRVDTTDYSPNNPLGQAWIVGSFKYP